MLNYNKPIRVGFAKVRPVNVQSERFTFGHRVSLGQLLGTGLTDYEIMAAWLAEWHDVKLKPKYIARLLPYFQEVINGLEFWADKEKALRYDPTAEERQAGYDQVSKQVQQFGAIDAIAVRMHMQHDDVLKLPYNTVYLMLLKDLETSKFERRLNKVYEQKSKRR